MKNYAVLDRNFIITNIIVAPSLEIAELVTSSNCVLVSPQTYVEIGWSYVDGVFVDQNATETPANVGLLPLGEEPA